MKRVLKHRLCFLYIYNINYFWCDIRIHFLILYHSILLASNTSALELRLLACAQFQSIMAIHHHRSFAHVLRSHLNERSLLLYSTNGTRSVSGTHSNMTTLPNGFMPEFVVTSFQANLDSFEIPSPAKTLLRSSLKAFSHSTVVIAVNLV